MSLAIKRLNKHEMMQRNKVHRVKVEEEILGRVDHPFLPTMYASFQTEKHLHFVLDLCPGGELYQLLMAQPAKHFSEAHGKFFAAEVRPLSLPASHPSATARSTGRNPPRPSQPPSSGLRSGWRLPESV